MGDVISKAANAVGGVLGNALAAPFKSIFGESCQEICTGPWDVICFIEHLCVSNLLKLMMILALCYIILLFFYLLFKIGICQCIVKSLCKIFCVACETYCYALEDCTCFCWHKLMSTKRINRRRRYNRDIEIGNTSSSSESDLSNKSHRIHAGRNSRSVIDRRAELSRSSVYSSSRRLHHRNRAKGRSLRLKSSRGLKVSNVGKSRVIRKRRRR